MQLVNVGVLPRITVSPGNPLAGQLLTLGGATSLVSSGRSIFSYAWSIASTGGIVTSFTSSTTGANATIRPSAAGQFSVSLTVVDNLGAQATTTSNVAVAPAQQTSGGATSSGGGALSAAWLALLLGAVLVLARRRA